jgi:hypothetical protein
MKRSDNREQPGGEDLKGGGGGLFEGTIQEFALRY